MPTILHEGVPVRSLEAYSTRQFPDTFAYDVLLNGEPMRPRRWVQVTTNNYVARHEVSVSVQEDQGPGKWPKFLGELKFRKGSKTLASLPELRRKGVTLRPGLHFQIENPPLLNARKIRIQT